MSGRPWGDFELARLKALVAQGYCQIEIGRALRRHSSSIRGKATKLGLELQPYKGRRWAPLNPNPSTWNASEKICAFANVPLELAMLVTNTCIDHDLPVKLVRSDDKRGKMVKCRAQIARKARDLGFSFPLIGRAINRDHTSVMYLTREHAA